MPEYISELETDEMKIYDLLKKDSSSDTENEVEETNQRALEWIKTYDKGINYLVQNGEKYFPENIDAFKESIGDNVVSAFTESENELRHEITNVLRAIRAKKLKNEGAETQAEYTEAKRKAEEADKTRLELEQMRDGLLLAIEASKRWESSDARITDGMEEKLQAYSSSQEGIERLLTEHEKAMLSNFEQAAEILLGDEHRDKVRAINEQLKDVFESDGFKRFRNNQRAGVQNEKFQVMDDALENLRKLGKACEALIKSEVGTQKRQGALRRLAGVLADICMGGGKTFLRLEASYLKRMADTQDFNKTALQRLGHGFLLVLTYLAKRIVGGIVHIKAWIKDTSVTVQDPIRDNPEESEYPRRRIRDKTRRKD